MNVTDAKTGNKQWRDVIMPGIYEQRITAFRTGQMAGQDDPVFGEIISFNGMDVPEWCRVTVYRFINGERCAFSHTEYFTEACATTKDGKLNSVWSKRPRGQLAKCAEAGALRKAFPDELGGVITADEVNEDQINPPEDKSNIINGQSVELVTDEQIERIAIAFQNKTEKEYDSWVNTVDSSVIGGVQLKTKEFLLDGTISNKLKQFKEKVSQTGLKR